MNKIIISPYRHTYSCSNSSTLFLYDSIANKPYELPIEFSDCAMDKGIIYFKNMNERIRDFAEALSMDAVAFVNWYKEGENYFSFDYYGIQKQLYAKLLKGQFNDHNALKKYVREVIVSFSSIYNAFLLRKKEPESLVIDYEILSSFLSNENYENLSRLRLVFDKITSVELNELMECFGTKYDLEIILPFSYYNYLPKLFKQKSSSHKIKFQFMIDSIADKKECLSCLSVLNSKSVSILFMFEKSSDASLLNKLSRIPNIKIKVMPLYDDNYSFLYRYLKYSKKDIFTGRHNINGILRKELINDLYWGKLFVECSGDVLSCPDRKLGSIKDGIVEYSSLLGKDSLWLATRNRFDPCKSCNFKCFCPPLSLIEIVSGNTFCHLNKSL